MFTRPHSTHFTDSAYERRPRDLNIGCVVRFCRVISLVSDFREWPEPLAHETHFCVIAICEVRGCARARRRVHLVILPGIISFAHSRAPPSAPEEKQLGKVVFGPSIDDIQPR